MQRLGLRDIFLSKRAMIAPRGKYGHAECVRRVNLGLESTVVLVSDSSASSVIYVTLDV